MLAALALAPPPLATFVPVQVGVGGSPDHYRIGRVSLRSTRGRSLVPSYGRYRSRGISRLPYLAPGRTRSLRSLRSFKSLTSIQENCAHRSPTVGDDIFDRPGGCDDAEPPATQLRRCRDADAAGAHGSGALPRRERTIEPPLSTVTPTVRPLPSASRAATISEAISLHPGRSADRPPDCRTIGGR